MRGVSHTTAPDFRSQSGFNYFPILRRWRKTTRASTLGSRCAHAVSHRLRSGCNRIDRLHQSPVEMSFASIDRISTCPSVRADAFRIDVAFRDRSDTRNSQWLLMSMDLLVGVAIVEIASLVRFIPRSEATSAVVLIPPLCCGRVCATLSDPVIHDRIVDYSGHAAVRSPL